MYTAWMELYVLAIGRGVGVRSISTLRVKTLKLVQDISCGLYVYLASLVSEAGQDFISQITFVIPYICSFVRGHLS